MIDRVIKEITEPLTEAGIAFFCCDNLERTAQIANSHFQYATTDGLGNNILHTLALASRGSTMYELLERIDGERAQVLLNMKNSDGWTPQEVCRIYSTTAYKEL